MQAKMGISPIAWSNEDLPELGGDVSLETCLSDSREAGFSGVELGVKFPKNSEALRKVLKAHDLKLASGWYSGTLLDNELENEIDQINKQLQLLKDLDASCIIYGETAGTIQGKRDVPLNRRRTLTEQEIRVYGHKMTALAEHCADFGMPLAFHHHMAAAIETEKDLDRLMTHTGQAVGLLFDPGHMVFAGGDLIRTIDNHGARIIHVHTKDVRTEILASIDRDGHSFLNAVLEGVFTVPGDGLIDFKAIVGRLADQGYEGWFIVEAEQDPANAPPLEYAKMGHNALSEALTSAGYTIEP